MPEQIKSLTDPQTTFRFNITTERDAAVRRRQLLMVQLDALNKELASVNAVIAGANAALDASNPEPILAELAPTNMFIPIGDELQSPLGADGAALNAVQQALDEQNPPPSEEPPIPAFLARERHPNT